MGVHPSSPLGRAVRRPDGTGQRRLGSEPPTGRCSSSPDGPSGSTAEALDAVSSISPTCPSPMPRPAAAVQRPGGRRAPPDRRPAPAGRAAAWLAGWQRTDQPARRPPGCGRLRRRPRRRRRRGERLPAEHHRQMLQALRPGRGHGQRDGPHVGASVERGRRRRRTPVGELGVRAGADARTLRREHRRRTPGGRRRRGPTPTFSCWARWASATPPRPPPCAPPCSAVPPRTGPDGAPASTTRPGPQGRGRRRRPPACSETVTDPA